MFYLLPLIAAVPIDVHVCDELLASMEYAIVEEIITMEEAGEIYSSCMSYDTSTAIRTTQSV